MSQTCVILHLRSALTVSMGSPCDSKHQRDLQAVAPNIAKTHIMPTTTTRTLQTGIIAEESATMIVRADPSLPKSRTTRKARRRRSVLMIFMSIDGTSEIVVTATMQKSKTLNELLQKGQNQFAAMFNKSSKRKMIVNTISRLVKIFATLPTG